MQICIKMMLIILLIISTFSIGSAKQKYTIGVSLPAQNPFYMNCKYGIELANKDLGLNIMLTFADEDQGKQLRDLEDFVQAQVDLIIVSPVEAVGAVGPIESAIKAGVPVLQIVRRANTDLSLGWIGMDEVDLGRRIGKYLLSKLGPKGGKVVMLAGLAGSSYSVECEQGFMSVISQNPNIKIVARLHGRDDRVTGMRLMEDILQGLPEFDAVVAWVDETAIGAIQAIEAAGLDLNKIIVASGGGHRPGREAVAAGKLDYTGMKQPGYIGKLALEMAYEYLKTGKRPPKITRVPYVDVTIENVKSIDTRWNPY